MAITVKGPKPKFVPFVAIKPVEKNRATIIYGFNTFVAKARPSGRVSCFIPAFGIHYSVADKNDIKSKGLTLTRLYLDHFFKRKRSDWKGFVLELHKLGFRAAEKDSYVINELINKRLIPAKFSSGVSAPPEFINHGEAQEERLVPA
jgi:hypothetical protein